MSQGSRHESLRRRTEAALVRYGRTQAECERRRDQLPRPGELFVFAATADFDLQWAVVDPDPKDEGRLVVVPADLNPLLGSADVAVSAESACGALSLRCGFGVSLAAEDFELRMRTGVLEPEILEQARRKRAEIAAGSLISSARERETDAEPEYQDWAEEILAEAQAALATKARRGPPAAEESFYFNGIDALTGQYQLPPVAFSEAAEWARRERIDPGVLRLLEHVHHYARQAHLGLPGGVDPKDVAQAGWAVVFRQGESAAVRDALEPLIAHRRAQLGAPRTKVLEYRPGDDWRDWLARHGVGAGDVQPVKVPYYLLLIGDPAEISWEFQSLLGLEYAVGRLSFEDASDYRRYVRSVVACERGTAALPAGQAVFFAPRHPGDPVSQLTADQLVKPLMGALDPAAGLWGEDATKANLVAVLHRRKRPPALLFAAAHGLGWPCGDRHQLAAQGALLCQDWPGSGRIAADQWFGAADLADDARVGGTIALLSASFSAGTPERETIRADSGEAPARLAERPFVARLARRFLAHPGGGALAVVGAVGRAGSGSLALPASARRWQPLTSALEGLFAGRPVGHAVCELSQTYAAVACELVATLKKAGFGAQLSEPELAAAWSERSCAQGYVVLGDPAVRMGMGGGRPPLS